MENLLRQIDILLSDISVKGQDVFTMAQARQGLKHLYEIAKATSEVKARKAKEDQNAGCESDIGTDSSPTDK